MNKAKPHAYLDGLGRGVVPVVVRPIVHVPVPPRLDLFVVVVVKGMVEVVR